MPVDDEVRAALEALKAETLTSVHSAVASHLKKELPKSIGEALKGAIPEMAAPLMESVKGQLEEFKKSLGTPAGGGGPPGSGSPASDPADLGKNPMFAAMQTELTKVRDQLTASERRRAETEEQAWKDKSYASLQGYVQKYAKPDLLDVATDLLFKRVIKHDDGTPVLVVKRPLFNGGPEEEQRLPLDVAVDDWSRSKDGARFLPPPNMKRGGQSAPGRTGVAEVQGPQFAGPAKSDREKIHRSMAREQALAEQFPNLSKT